MKMGVKIEKVKYSFNNLGSAGGPLLIFLGEVLHDFFILWVLDKQSSKLSACESHRGGDLLERSEGPVEINHHIISHLADVFAESRCLQEFDKSFMRVEGSEVKT